MSNFYSRLRATGQTPRYHGNGMVQLYLTRSIRLHVHTTPDGGVVSHNALVHDHQFHMQSTVLFGCLRHELLEFYSRPGGPRDMHMLTDGENKTTSGSVLLDRGHTEVLHEFELWAGSRYHQDARTFHRTRPEVDGTVTLIRKTSDTRPQRARVVCPRGEKPHSAFGGNQPDELWMWGRIQRGVESIELDRSCERLDAALREAGV